MNRLALGTAQLGLPYGIANQVGQVPQTEAKAMLKFALANGIDTLDTAIMYGDSETCLGKVGVESFKIVTKLPAFPEDCSDVTNWVQGQVSASLSRLGVSSVYGLLLHRPNQLLGPYGATLYQALRELKDSGQTQKIGISIYSPKELETLIPKFQFDLVQAPFNLIDRRLFVSGWLYRLKDNGIEVHTRSVFLQGLLLMNQAEMPDKFSSWNILWHKWHQWLLIHGASAVPSCLALPLSYPEIDRVVVGADSLNQLAQILSATNSKYTGELPDLQSEDENLINPAQWSIL